MVDVWREKNGMKREYSRIQIVDRILKQSRIDLFLCKKEEAHYVTNASFKKYSESDHDFLWIMMNFNEIDKGPGGVDFKYRITKNGNVQNGNRKH